MAPPLGIVEAHMKSELLTTKILPEDFITYIVGSKRGRRGGTIVEILELLFQLKGISPRSPQPEWTR
eukprot:6490605-Amphidinium_carterae.2